jgi:cell division protease FtsH
VLTDHRDALDRLALALLEYETIDSHEVEMLVNGAAVSEVRKVRDNKTDGTGIGPGSVVGVTEGKNETAPVVGTKIVPT